MCAYSFEIDSGQENDLSRRCDNKLDLEATNHVVRFVRAVPKHSKYKLYCDNYNTTIDLFVHLTKLRIYALGTVRKNITPNNKIFLDENLKKKKEGFCQERVATVNEGEIACVFWLGNKQVMLMSTFGCSLPMTKIERFSKNKERKCQLLAQVLSNLTTSTWVE